MSTAPRPRRRRRHPAHRARLIAAGVSLTAFLGLGTGLALVSPSGGAATRTVSFPSTTTAGSVAHGSTGSDQVGQTTTATLPASSPVSSSHVS